MIEGTEKELLPVISKLGGTVDRVNEQLDKVDQITDSAVDAVTSVDTAVRSVTGVVAHPIEKVAGLFAGARHATSTLRTARKLAGCGRDREGGSGSARAGHRRRASGGRVTEEIVLTLPRQRRYYDVAHLVVGGLAARLDLTVDTLADLQTALDGLLQRERRR